MKKFLSSIFLLPAILCSAFAAEFPLTLDSAISLALKQNRQLALSSLSVNKGAMQVQFEEQAFEIQLRPEGDAGVGSKGQETTQYGAFASKKSIWGTELITGVNVNDNQFNCPDREHRATARVELKQPLFRYFGPLINENNLVVANEQLLTERRLWEAKKSSLVIDVVRYFEAIIRLKRQIEADKAFFQRANKLYSLTKIRERQGRATHVDTLRVELQRGQSQSRLENDQEQLSTYSRNFAEMLGLPLDTDFLLQPPPLLDVPLPPPEEAVREALEYRMDFAQTLQDYKTSQRNLRIAKRSLLPTVNFLARYKQFGEGQNYGDSFRFNDNDWFVGLAAETDLNKSQDKTKVSEAGVDVDSAHQIIAIKCWEIAREVQQSMSNYRRWRVELQIAERNYKLAESRAELARHLFKIGRGDNFSVTDAEEASKNAEIQLLATRAEASLSGYLYLHALGTLIQHPDQLRAPDVDEAMKILQSAKLP